MTLPPGSICAPCRQRGQRIPARSTGGVHNRYAMCLDCSLYRRHWQPPSHLMHAAREWLAQLPRERGIPLPDEIRAAILDAPGHLSNSELRRRYGVSLRRIAELKHATGALTVGMQRNAGLPGRRGWRGVYDAPRAPRVAQ